VLAAERLRKGEAPTAQQLATADPETFAREMQVILRTRPPELPAKAAASRSARLPALGRPSEYSQEEADAICQWIQDGKSLQSYCLRSGRHVGTVYRWLMQRADFREAYARAHDDRADTLVDEMTDIADGCHPTIEAVAKAKLQIETRRWCAERMRPTKWGLQQATGPQQPITFNIGISRQPERITIDASPVSQPALPAASSD
jgi:hypothetical protein